MRGSAPSTCSTISCLYNVCSYVTFLRLCNAFPSLGFICAFDDLSLERLPYRWCIRLWRSLDILSPTKNVSFASLSLSRSLNRMQIVSFCLADRCNVAGPQWVNRLFDRVCPSHFLSEQKTRATRSYFITGSLESLVVWCVRDSSDIGQARHFFLFERCLIMKSLKKPLAGWKRT